MNVNKFLTCVIVCSYTSTENTILNLTELKIDS